MGDRRPPARLEAAGEVTRRGREVLGQMLLELERRGVLLVEADTDGVLFSVPAAWTEADERKLIEEVGAILPDGISVEHDGRYAAMYSYAEKNYALQGYDGKVRLAAGRDRWKGGDRVTYYQARGGRKKLAEEYADDEDAEYYVRRLKEIYCQRLSKALAREDFELLFGENLSLWETNLADIRPLTT